MSNGPQYRAVHVVWLPMIKLPHTVKQASGDLTHCANPGQLVHSLLVGHDISARLPLNAGQAYSNSLEEPCQLVPVLLAEHEAPADDCPEGICKCAGFPLLLHFV